MCRPYRAKTKGKVERFNRYLKGSFIVPLQASLRAEGLKLDVQTANGCIGPWLMRVANARIHGTTQEIPNQRLIKEKEVLLPLPIRTGNVVAARSLNNVPMPIESLQHPLSTYDALFLGEGHEFTI